MCCAAQRVRGPKGYYKAERNLAHRRAGLTGFHGLLLPEVECASAQASAAACSLRRPCVPAVAGPAGLTAIEPVLEASKISPALKRFGGGMLRGP